MAMQREHRGRRDENQAVVRHEWDIRYACGVEVVDAVGGSRRMWRVWGVLMHSGPNVFNVMQVKVVSRCTSSFDGRPLPSLVSLWLC